MEDASFLLLGLLLIFLLVWSFTASLTITLACLSSIAASLGLAFFTYSFVLNLSFFPFMNVLALIIALGGFLPSVVKNQIAIEIIQSSEEMTS